MKILIADDDCVLGKVLCRFFAAIGHEAACVSEWHEAAAAMEASVPDCVLADSELGGVPASEFCAKVRADGRFSSTALLLYSGDDFVEVGCADGRMLKGVSLDHILKTVEEAVKKRR